MTMSHVLVENGNNEIGDDKADDIFLPPLLPRSRPAPLCDCQFLYSEMRERDREIAREREREKERERERERATSWLQPTEPAGEYLLHFIMQHLKLMPDCPQANMHNGNRTHLEIYVHRNPFGIYVNSLCTVTHTHTHTHTHIMFVPVQFSPGPYCSACSRPLSVSSEPLSPLRGIQFVRVCPCHTHTAYIRRHPDAETEKRSR